MLNDEFFMQEALKQAQLAFEKDEVPVGAVIVFKDRIIARAHNMSQTLNDVTAHAEMQAFTSAANTLGGKYLKECTLYVTLEPCVMCGGAAAWTQISKIVFGTMDDKKGYSKLETNILHPKTQVVRGVLEKECSQILKEFFQTKRS
jgi:tRNA(adenine34) deaminase